ncbi:hypothetical protein DFQ28_004094 [Apophysomyces sp. BC1034]|nr:hypothetical protein DFQ30_001347 [Apophysomyces sp. BC1015]KAG0182451.1 hypothetical protein DFQ29_004073 [Apophysomyces sp. BC1021]KAG0193653.1 hypothetical protein DFQ28_004094 [Apophysomyces sp. BC1034]
MGDDHLSKALESSLNDLKREMDEQEREKDDLKKAIAASLGKSVDQLTARDLLNATMDGDSSNKRRLPPDITDAPPNKKPRPEKYWDGVVKLTHVTGFSGLSFITSADIVQKSMLKKAVITAFVSSMDWIEEHFPEDVNLCLVTHGRPAIRKQYGSNRVIIHAPMKDEKFGVFHTKLMLLFHESSLRVVIGSANLERYDYNDLENVVFIQDFPQTTTRLKSFSQLPNFASDLCDLLDLMHVPPSVKEEFLGYDFSKAKAHIVASVSGVFEGKENYRKYGHARLAQVIKDIGAFDPARLPKIEMQTSSLGSVNASFLHEIYTSFCGIDPYENGAKPRGRKKEGLPPIEIIFPTQETVEMSKLGPPFIIATLPSSGNTAKENELRGWVYCGSHNATLSAWGKLTLSRETREAKMTMNNWELGVVLPLYDSTEIPSTYRRPAPLYRPGQDAWTQDFEW